MCKTKNEEYNIVTEVGVFGDLNIEDPTSKKVKTEDELQELIKDSIEHNATIKNV